MNTQRMIVIRGAVRDQVINAIQADLDGGESLMKEVWELCEDDNEQKVAERECRRIIYAIQHLGALHLRGEE
jgi:hypothetical protein